MNSNPVPRSGAVAPQATRGALWSVAQNGGKHVLALAVFLLMARLLDPEAYGAIALAGVVVTLVNALVEQGFNDALVQRAVLERSHLDAAFWLALVCALALAGGLLVAGPFIATLLGQPQIGPVLQCLAPLFPMQALAVVPQALLQRRFAFRTLAIRALVALITGGIVGVTLAARGFGVWSLVAQQLSSGAAGLVVLWAGSRWRPSLEFSRRHAADLYHFGRHIIGFNLLDFVKRKSDDLIVGVFLGPAALGAYNLAYQILLMLEQLLCKGFDAVALSAFSRLQSDLGELREAYYTAARFAALVAFPTFLGAALVMPELVEGLLGEKWRAAVPVMQILMLVGALHAVFHYNHAVFKACGQPQLSTRLAIFEAIANIGLFLLTVRWGIEAVAAAYVAIGYLMAPISLLLVHRLLTLDLKRYLRQFVLPLMASLAMGAGVFAIQWAATEQYGARSLLALLILTGVVAYVASLRFLAPALSAQVLAQLRLARTSVQGGVS